MRECCVAQYIYHISCTCEWVIARGNRDCGRTAERDGLAPWLLLPPAGGDFKTLNRTATLISTALEPLVLESGSLLLDNLNTRSPGGLFITILIFFIGSIIIRIFVVIAATEILGDIGEI